MKLVNLLTGSTLSVEDTHGERLINAGGWAKSTTAAAKKAISDTIARNGRTPTALTPAPDGDPTGDAGDQGADGTGDAGENTGTPDAGKEAGNAPAKDAGKK